MRSLILGVSVAALAAATAPAVAADFYDPGPGVVIEDDATGFEGFYAGVSVGGAWISGQIADLGPNYSNNAGWADVESSSGFLLGGHIGYNFLVTDSILLGIEAGVDGVFSGDTICSIDEGCGDYHGPGSPALAFNVNGLGSIVGRIGFLPTDDILVYVLAGPAAASVTTHHWDDADYDGSNRMFTGWTAGLGAELMVSNNTSIGVEGRYYTFGQQTWTDSTNEDFGAQPNVFTGKIRASVHF